MIATVRALAAEVRTGQFCQSIRIAGQDYLTYWPSTGARDRFLLAVTATEHGSPARQPITTRGHWS